MIRPLPRQLLLVAGILLLAACSKAPSFTPPPPEVDVVIAHAVNLPLTRDLVGRLTPTLTAQVNARVTGNVLQRVYTEGSDVKAGQVLFRIDPAPLQAALDAQRAALAQARATAANAAQTASRYADLVQRGLIARQTYDDAEATARSSAAAVRQAAANVETAQLNLSYATVTSPIAGRAGIALVTVGALVSASAGTPMTTVERIDPIYANFSEPYSEVEKLRAAQAKGQLRPTSGGAPAVQLVLPDGSIYAHTGSLDFSDMAVDPQTGAVQLRALIPNPDRSLLPGLFVTVRLHVGTLDHVFLLPQAAVQRDATNAFVFVLGTDDKVVQQTVQLGEMHGADWVITGGIQNGQRVVVSGIQKVHAGITARAVAPTAAAAR
jgi:membrane fusion protein (multidrug efflux system)